MPNLAMSPAVTFAHKPWCAVADHYVYVPQDENDGTEIDPCASAITTVAGVAVWITDTTGGTRVEVSPEKTRDMPRLTPQDAALLGAVLASLAARAVTA